MKKDRGFTLIEILVTVTILALITIIAVPSVITINKKVKEKMFNTKMQQAEEAIILWAQNNPNCITGSGTSCIVDNCPSSKEDSNIKVCTVTLGTLAQNNLIAYDDEAKKEIFSPINNDDISYLEITFTYNTNNRKFNVTKNNYLKSTTTSTTSAKNPVSDNNPVSFPKKLEVAIRENYPTIETPKTTPGTEDSASDEALLASTEDDYGTSYYFRGNVTNNYVQFANKCWRIVRITGNGAIKLILHNDNINNVDNPCDSTNNATDAAYARYSGTTYTSAFNSRSNNNAYAGFMYGTPGSSTYETEHANVNDSTILTNLKKWYDLTFDANQKEQLADVIWCNDKSTTDLGYGTNASNYAAYIRTTPTLICPYDKQGGKLSKFTANDTKNGNGALKGYKIGLLTVDEIVFAGGKKFLANETYLFENTKNADIGWWTMSPSYLDSRGYARNFLINGFGYVYDQWGDDSKHGVRPSIALLSTIEISSGTGTSSDPFVVN